MISQVIRRFVQGGGFDSAVILSYSTLLTMVPILFLSLSVFSISEYFSGYKSLLMQFVFDNILPTQYEVVEKYLTQFIEQTGNLTGISIVFLVGTALLLLYEVDKRINLIWQNKQPRHWVKGWLSYVVILFVSPLFLAISLAISTYFFNFGTQQIQGYLFALLPFVFLSLGFALLYYGTPMAKVDFKFALAGGMLTAFLLEGLKFLLGFYVQYFHTYEVIYGTLAIIPLFILWIYLACITLLIGASLTCCLQNNK